jgi:ribonuclease P protein component
MLPRKNRITKDKEYELVFKTGRSSYSDVLGVKVIRNETDYSRYGIIVSNKISKKATVRNRLKRQLREVLRGEFNKIKPGYDIVLIAQAGIVGKQSSEIKETIIRQFKKLKILT